MAVTSSCRQLLAGTNTTASYRGTTCVSHTKYTLPTMGQEALLYFLAS